MAILLNDHSMCEMIALAEELTEEYRSLKSQGLKTEVDQAIETPRFTVDTLYIPRPTSLNDALYTLLIGSFMFDLDTSSVPTVVLHQTHLIANLLELVHRNTQRKTQLLTLEVVSKGKDDKQLYFLHVSHKHFEVDDTAITFIVLPNEIHIQTPKTIFLKSVETSVKRPLVKTTIAHFDAKSADYKVRLSVKLSEFKEVIEGEYTVARK